ncbi:MAG: PD40 domain-containing protein [Proteobacteria bacterium]|nr:PD40 domain-containing protein [Pseudomonadota bacterium]
MISNGWAVLALWLAAGAPATGAATPHIFAPGVISGPAQDDAPAFTPDGATVVFASGSGNSSAILVSHRQGQGWSKPELAPFSGEWNDQQPTMAPDGAFLVFVSNRPVHAGDAKHPSGNLWRVARAAQGWGVPERLPDTVNADASVWAPSIAGDGSLYCIRRQKPGGPLRLMRSQRTTDGYAPAQPISFGDETSQDVDPAVAPDESFIVFASGHPESGKPERLFIAFRKGSGWGPPEDMGDAVNGPSGANGARLSPDRRTLYFTSDRSAPTHYPRTREETAAALERARSWDNGSNNIWSVDLGPWLDRPRT